MSKVLINLRTQSNNQIIIKMYNVTEVASDKRVQYNQNIKEPRADFEGQFEKLKLLKSSFGYFEN